MVNVPPVTGVPPLLGLKIWLESPALLLLPLELFELLLPPQAVTARAMAATPAPHINVLFLMPITLLRPSSSLDQQRCRSFVRSASVLLIPSRFDHPD
jgi:hypothetical protein